MPTVLTHPAIALAVRAVAGGTRTSRRLVWFAALCSVLPDVDALGFVFGVPYESLFGHRGLTHSLAFALLLACCALPLAGWLHAGRRWAFAFVLLGTTSHGVLDALTDDGLGVAFLSPFSNERYFLPWRPIPASPIGILELFSSSGLHVLTAELLLIWLPCLLVVVLAKAAGGPWRGTPSRAGVWTAGWRAVGIGMLLAVASTLAGGYGSGVSIGRGVHSQAHDSIAHPPVAEQAMLAEAIANLETQAARLAAQPGAACPQDFPALATGRALRIALFYGYDEHDGKVRDRAHAEAMAHVLASDCRGQLSTCGFAPVLRSRSVVRLTRTIGDRSVEVTLFTSSQPEATTADARLRSGDREPEWLGLPVREQFLRELVESDIVFYMGHSRLGGSIGFAKQTGVTTVVDAVLRLPMQPVLEALRQRPTRLKMIGMFSCSSKEYFQEEFQGANPALSLILTTGEIRYAPAEQASLGALEAVLASSCGHAFHRSMISVAEPDPTMTYLFRGH